MLKDCAHPVSYTRAASNRVPALNRSRERAVHIVLAHLCQELDQNCDLTQENNFAENNAVVFKSFLVGDDSFLKDKREEPHDLNVTTMAKPTFGHCNELFWGACLDSSAHQTVIRNLEADSYLSMAGQSITFSRCRTKKRFWFGSVTHKEICYGESRIPVGKEHFVQSIIFFVPINIPQLLRLDAKRKLKFIIKLASQTLQMQDKAWFSALTFKQGHLHFEWPNDLCNTEL